MVNSFLFHPSKPHLHVRACIAEWYKALMSKY